jgi:ABC-type glutathione transport system ATPase component
VSGAASVMAQRAMASSTAKPDAPLLRVERLVKHFPVKSGFLGRSRGAAKAVDDVSFTVAPGEILALVGESGCGKSTTGRLILRLIEANSGAVYFQEKNIFALGGKEMRGLRRAMQIVFQDPYASLNPRMTVGEMLAEPLALNGLASGTERMARVEALLGLVGLAPYHIRRYPHEFSGGQRQRIGIARALAVKPSLIVCDEPVSALDASIQAQVVNLLQNLQRRFRLSYVFIAHDLAVVKHIACDQILARSSFHVVRESPAEPCVSDTDDPDAAPLGKGNCFVDADHGGHVAVVVAAVDKSGLLVLPHDRDGRCGRLFLKSFDQRKHAG